MIYHIIKYIIYDVAYIYMIWCRDILHHICNAFQPWLLWFCFLVQWDVSTMIVLLCPNRTLGDLLVYFPYWRQRQWQTITLRGNSIGAWTSTTAVWTLWLQRSMSFALWTSTSDLQMGRWGWGGVSGTCSAWTGWSFLSNKSSFNLLGDVCKFSAWFLWRYAYWRYAASYAYGDIMIMVETNFLIALSLSNASAATFSII